jgi:hypothetical protein
VAGTAAKAQPFKRTRAKADLGSHLRSMEVQGAQNIWAQPMAAPTHY